jgi:predicted AAA+ superfamily ATPase
MKQYQERLIEKTIQRQMEAIGAIVLEGPKWCGKSTTAARFAKTVVKLQNPITYKQYQSFATTSIENLLNGEKPLMFDEWQKIPEIWDFIRFDIDENGGTGQYILTSSAKPVEDGYRHTGTGRITKITMRPMSLWESKDSTGEVSLKDVFDGKHDIFGKSKLSLDDIAFVTCRGGWPESVVKQNQALTLATDYFKALTTEDINSLDGVKRNPRRAVAVLRSYARNISTFATNATLLADIFVNDTTMDAKTLASYISAFTKLFVIEDVLAWSPKLRSKAIIRSAAKRQFVDPSIAAIALNAKPNDLINDLNTFGFLFESLCDRDLRIYADHLGGEVYHYHDADGLEADAILHLPDGRWGAVEIKLGGDLIDEAAKNLLKLKKKVDTDKVNEPSFLMVLTAAPNAYKRPDGVLVVPITCLKI